MLLARGAIPRELLLLFARVAALRRIATSYAADETGAEYEDANRGAAVRVLLLLAFGFKDCSCMLYFVFSSNVLLL